MFHMVGDQKRCSNPNGHDFLMELHTWVTMGTLLDLGTLGTM